MPSSFWHGLASLPGGRALPVVWQSRFGPDFATVQPFLQPTPDCAERFPCAGCDCDHEVREDFEWERVGVCTCGACEPIKLERRDLVIHELDWLALGAVIRRALGFPSTDPPQQAVTGHAVELGLHAPLHAPVYLYVPASEAALLRELETLLGTRPGPFLLLTPTRHGFTPAVDSVLNRAACASVALSTILDPAALIPSPGQPSVLRSPSSEATPPISASQRFNFQHFPESLQPVLADWASRAAGAREHGRTLLEIHREIAAVRQDFTELRTARQRLEKMLADGMFKFTQQVDATSFQVLCAILAEGDVAKAGRRIGFSDSLMRYHLRQWAGRGAAYASMLDLVRWRKKVGRKQTVTLNEAIFHDTTVATDYPSLLSDVLDGLLSMTEASWSDLCNELANLLRPVVAKNNQPNSAHPTPARSSLL